IRGVEVRTPGGKDRAKEATGRKSAVRGTGPNSEGLPGSLPRTPEGTTIEGGNLIRKRGYEIEIPELVVILNRRLCLRDCCRSASEQSTKDDYNGGNERDALAREGLTRHDPSPFNRSCDSDPLRYASCRPMSN